MPKMVQNYVRSRNVEKRATLTDITPPEEDEANKEAAPKDIHAAMLNLKLDQQFSSVTPQGGEKPPPPTPVATPAPGGGRVKSSAGSKDVNAHIFSKIITRKKGRSKASQHNDLAYLKVTSPSSMYRKPRLTQKAVGVVFIPSLFGREPIAPHHHHEEDHGGVTQGEKANGTGQNKKLSLGGSLSARKASQITMISEAHSTVEDEYFDIETGEYFRFVKPGKKRRRNCCSTRCKICIAITVGVSLLLIGCIVGYTVYTNGLTLFYFPKEETHRHSVCRPCPIFCGCGSTVISN